MSLPPDYKNLSQIIFGVASIGQSNTSTPPRLLVLPSLGFSPSKPSSSVTITSVPVQHTICVASSALVVTHQSSGSFHTRRSIFLNPTWPVNLSAGKSQPHTVEATPASSVAMNSSASPVGLTFEEYLLVFQ